MSKYKVINTTVKQPKIHPTTGKDLRSWTDKLGHGVQFRDPKGDVVKVDTNRPRITDYLTEGMLRLQRGKYIRIEEIGDVVEVLKNHTLSSNPSALLEPDHNVLAGVSHASSAPRSRATAVEMGKDQTVERGENHMVNPDGEPNFAVRADKNVKRKLKVEAPAPEAPAAT